MPNLILPENEAVFSLFKEIKTLIENAKKRFKERVKNKLLIFSMRKLYLWSLSGVEMTIINLAKPNYYIGSSAPLTDRL